VLQDPLRREDDEEETEDDVEGFVNSLYADFPLVSHCWRSYNHLVTTRRNWRNIWTRFCPLWAKWRMRCKSWEKTCLVGRFPYKLNWPFKGKKLFFFVVFDYGTSISFFWNQFVNILLFKCLFCPNLYYILTQLNLKKKNASIQQHRSLFIAYYLNLQLLPNLPNHSFHNHHHY